MGAQRVGAGGLSGGSTGRKYDRGAQFGMCGGGLSGGSAGASGTDQWGLNGLALGAQRVVSG